MDEHWTYPLTFYFAKILAKLKLSLIAAMHKGLSRKIKLAITENQIKIEIQLKEKSNVRFV